MHISTKMEAFYPLGSWYRGWSSTLRVSLLLITSKWGLATVLAFRAGATKMLHLTSDENDEDEALNKEAKKREVNSVENDKHLQHWNQLLNLFKVLWAIHYWSFSQSLEKNRKTDCQPYLFGNPITSLLTNSVTLATPLQLGSVVLNHDSKQPVRTCRDFGVTSSYYELLQFKRSAASAANKDWYLVGSRRLWMDWYKVWVTTSTRTFLLKMVGCKHIPWPFFLLNRGWRLQWIKKMNWRYPD